jgi:hypothetical protein
MTTQTEMNSASISMPGFDCSQFPEGTRVRSICDGTSDLPDFGPGNTRENYLRLWSNQPPLAAPDLSCQHRGEQLEGTAGWIECPTCQQGKVRLRVFACAVHRRCVMTDPVADIAGCVGCKSRNPPPSGAAGGQATPAAVAAVEQPPAPAINVVFAVREISRSHPTHRGYWTEKTVRHVTSPDGSVHREEPTYRRLEPEECPAR